MQVLIMGRDLDRSRDHFNHFLKFVGLFLEIAAFVRVGRHSVSVPNLTG
jgi:hypothetical protein